MLSRRRVMATAAAALAAPGLARAEAARVLKIIPLADLAILDPSFTTATATRNHGFMIFDTLYGQTASGEAVPEMVGGAVTSSDGLQWDLTLRDGLKFHDGAPVLASDCVASLRRWAGRDAFGSTLMAATAALSAPDDRTIRFRLQAPFPLLPLALAKSVPLAPLIMPARVIPDDPAKPVTEMVGSGPFRFLADQRVPGSRVVYARNADYVPRADGTPGISCGPKRVFFDRVEWQVVPDPATALNAIRRGEVDWWERPLPDLVPEARTDRGLRVEITNKTGIIAVVRFNHLYPPFDNLAIRRLVLSAINQHDFAEAIAGSDPALWGAKLGAFTPGGPMASTDALDSMKGRTDFVALHQELLAAGYKGEKVVMLAGTDTPVNNATSEVFADLLRKIGFNVDYQSMDYGTVVQRRASQQPPDKGGWSVFATSADGDYSLDPTVAPMIRANGLKGYYGWPTSPEIERLYAAWFKAPDLASRKELARQLQVQTFEDVPYIPVAQVFLPTILRADIVDVLPGFLKCWNVRRA